MSKKTFTVWAVLGCTPEGSRDSVVLFTGTQKEVEAMYTRLYKENDTAENSGCVAIGTAGGYFLVYGYGSKRFYNPELFPNREPVPVGLLNQSGYYYNFKKQAFINL